MIVSGVPEGLGMVRPMLSGVRVPKLGGFEPSFGAGLRFVAYDETLSPYRLCTEAAFKPECREEGTSGTEGRVGRDASRPCNDKVRIMGRDDVLSVLTSHRSELDGFGVQSLRLFGSVAREEASTDSDVDLLVSFQGKPTFSNFMKLRIFLEDLLGVKVDLVTESGLRAAVRPYVEKDAIRVA